MDNSQFQNLADQLMLQIEQALDRYTGDADIDYQIHSGLMTMAFADGSKIVINRQEPLHQIWVATKQQGYHFEYQQGQWICNRSQQNLFSLLTEACSQQAGDRLVIE